MLPKMLKFRDFRPNQSILIRIADNGYKLDIGCKNFVFPDLDEMMAQLNWFLKGELTTFSSQFKEELGTLGSEAADGNDVPQTATLFSAGDREGPMGK